MICGVDNPTEKGITRVDSAKMYNLARQWSDKGFQVNTHAIGDAANRIAIDVYERLLTEDKASNTDKRYRIEHAQILVSHAICVHYRGNIV
jgi:predicted amidohydrolase YtcJ